MLAPALRVLAVGHMYPPHHFGGYELVWQAAMRHLASEGHAVRALTSDLDTGSAEPDDAYVRRNLRLYWRPHELLPLNALDRLRLERHNDRALAHELREFRPDVVCWWSMGGLSLGLMESVRRAGLPSVAFVHDDWPDYARHMDGWTRAFGGRWRRLAGVAERMTRVPTRVDLGGAAHYVFVSDTTRRRAIEAGLEPGPSSIAHSGIDPGFIDPAPEQPWDWRLLYVGRLDERKGIDTAIAALTHLPPRTTLTVVGGWDEREELRLRELAGRLGVAERVRFAGQTSRAEVRAAYGEADAVLFPVIWQEPWGLVPLEGMARGRPVVATGRGGSGEYLEDGVNALLFAAGDAAALAGAVVRLAENPELRARLNAAGLATAHRHTETVFNAAVLGELTAAVRGSTGR